MSSSETSFYDKQIGKVQEGDQMINNNSEMRKGVNVKTSSAAFQS